MIAELKTTLLEEELKKVLQQEKEVLKKLENVTKPI